jgi:RNA polymerase sigma factor (sigma-70 family)
VSDSINTVLRYLRRVSALQGGDSTDEELLGRFVAQRDETAFETLVQRHGPLVLGVCRRILGDAHDAEDAFQATFLVLVRKAASVRNRHLLGPWLHGVAYRTAINARADRTRRRAQETQAVDMSTVESTPDAGWAEVRPILDEEVQRLPGKYRVPFVLCYLENKTYEEAAQQLGCPRSTVATRLARARSRLRQCLARRGLALSTAGMIGMLSPDMVIAAPTPALVASTLRAALTFAVMPAAGSAGLSMPAALAERVLRGMFLVKLRLATAVLFLATLVGGGAGWLFSHGQGTGTPQTPGAALPTVPATAPVAPPPASSPEVPSAPAVPPKAPGVGQGSNSSQLQPSPSRRRTLVQADPGVPAILVMQGGPCSSLGPEGNRAVLVAAQLGIAKTRLRVGEIVIELYVDEDDVLFLPGAAWKGTHGGGVIVAPRVGDGMMPPRYGAPSSRVKS